MARFVFPQQMKGWSLWALWWFLIGGATIWLFVGAVSYWIRLGMLPGEVSDWVQAVGSILAVASGFILAFYQTSQAEKVAQRDRHIRLQDIAASKRDYLERAFYIAANSAAACGQFGNYWIDYPVRSPEQVSLLLGMIDRAGDEMECISVVEFDNSRLVNTWLGFKRDFSLFQLQGRALAANDTPVFGVNLGLRVNQIMLSLEEFNKAVLAYRGPVTTEFEPMI